MATLSAGARAYVAVVVAGGLLILGMSVSSLVTKSPSPDWLILAGLAILSGAFNIKVPGVPARISVSEAFVFAAVLLYGGDIATIIVVLDATVMSLRLRRDKKSAYRLPFNVAAATLAIWISSRLFFLILGSDDATAVRLDALLIPLLSLALSYFVLNSGLVAQAMSLESGAPPLILWRNNFLWLGLNYLGGASFAALIVSYRERVDVTMLSVIVPLLVITYLTFRTSFGRVEDANRHVSQLNELYLSTIETLAMAVDAKDQITHGHIRRVQVYATELARRLGVKDDRQLKAIEAAALLHDMGKLAIPEHILNKPGKLSSAEFGKMKEHANIGADLLSSIRFPYPVVPIVRHHHEYWDGSGYPSGIAGIDIPLGARILSVVDCFDALTSDRPYRPRLSTDEAFRILHDRRGTAYDPLVVDTFVASYSEIFPLAQAAGQQAKTLLFSHQFDDGVETVPNSTLQQIRVRAVETSRVFEARAAVADAMTTGAAFDALAQYLRTGTAATVCALFIPVQDQDAVACQFAHGEHGEALVGLTISNGQRVTGWVAANRTAVINSDASLDLGNIADAFRRRLTSVLSIPLLAQDRVVGVLSIYSPDVDAFTDDHKYFAEQLADPLGKRIAQSTRPPDKSVVPFPDTASRRPNRLG
jgi:putative nucleotidyltransferase with HDIG domain